MEYRIISQSYDCVLIETKREYIVAFGFDDSIEKWGEKWTSANYFPFFGIESARIEALFKAVDYFRNFTEKDYIPRERLETIATMLANKLVGDDKEDAIDYFSNTCLMSDEEKVFFGVNGTMIGIEFTIVTVYSREKYFAMINAEESIEEQIRKLLSDMCFCDEYRIVEFHEVSEDYISERKKLIKKYEMLHGEGSIEYDLCHGRHVTLDDLKNILKGE